MKLIKFKYLHDNDKCCLEEFNGCCCKCLFHHEVFKHCCHSPRGENCVCNESLEFYICKAPEMDRVNLSGKHGMCEMFTNRKRTDDDIKEIEKKQKEELKNRMYIYKS